jgi:hypothetical protein
MSDPAKSVKREHPPDDPAPARHELRSLGEGTENFYHGSEPFFTFFTQPQILLSTLRLTIQNQVIVPTIDLGSQMETCRRNFQHTGDLQVAMQDVVRLTDLFGRRVQNWEREVLGITHDKRGMSGTLIQRLKSEAAQIRVRIQSIDRALVKLGVTLHQMAGEQKGDGSD